MATIEESSVFEYCEKLYRELDERDGGYFPSRHDRHVFSSAASCFRITEGEVYRIFSDYSKHAADIEMEKISRLPIAIRKKILQRKASDIIKNNRDLPFFRLEGPPSENLSSTLDTLTDEYKVLVESIAQTGWTIPMNIDITRFRELMKIGDDALSLDRYFSDYYNRREFRCICRKITRAITLHGQQEAFSECVEAFESGLYSVCLTALIVVLEGVISTFGDNPQDVRIMRICNFHARAEKEKRSNIKSLCWLSMYEFVRLLYRESDFSQPEPDALNRHWILHGRTGRSGDRIDCLRIFNALSTMASIKQYLATSDSA